MPEPKQKPGNSKQDYREIPSIVNYVAGVDGHIYSTRHRWGLREVPRLVKSWPDEDGYPHVHLSIDGVRRNFVVHVLIAQAWISRPEGRVEVRHKDGSRDNNAPDNLCWGTTKENADDRERHGRTVRGSRVASSKLTKRWLCG
jgi:hypothetical protein